MTSTPTQPTFTVGDTRPTLRGTLTTTPAGSNTAVPVDGTGATCELHVLRPDQTVVTAPVSVAADGTWAYDWKPGDLSVPGTHFAEVQVTGAAGSITTFGRVTFDVRKQIA